MEHKSFPLYLYRIDKRGGKVPEAAKPLRKTPPSERRNVSQKVKWKEWKGERGKSGMKTERRKKGKE